MSFSADQVSYLLRHPIPGTSFVPEMLSRQLADSISLSEAQAATADTCICGMATCLGAWGNGCGLGLSDDALGDAHADADEISFVPVLLQAEDEPEAQQCAERAADAVQAQLDRAMVEHAREVAELKYMLRVAADALKPYRTTSGRAGGPNMAMRVYDSIMAKLRNGKPKEASATALDHAA